MKAPASDGQTTREYNKIITVKLLSEGRAHLLIASDVNTDIIISGITYITESKVYRLSLYSYISVKILRVTVERYNIRFINNIRDILTGY